MVEIITACHLLVELLHLFHAQIEVHQQRFVKIHCKRWHTPLWHNDTHGLIDFMLYMSYWSSASYESFCKCRFLIKMANGNIQKETRAQIGPLAQPAGDSRIATIDTVMQSRWMCAIDDILACSQERQEQHPLDCHHSIQCKGSRSKSSGEGNDFMTSLTGAWTFRGRFA